VFAFAFVSGLEVEENKCGCGNCRTVVADVILCIKYFILQLSHEKSGVMCAF